MGPGRNELVGTCRARFRTGPASRVTDGANLLLGGELATGIATDILDRLFGV